MECKLSVSRILSHSKDPGGDGLHITEIAFLLFTQPPPVNFSAFPNIYLNVAEIYRQGWLEESAQRLENVERSHLALASGKVR